MRAATLHRNCGRWYITLKYKLQVAPLVDNGHVLGVDRNVGQAADSDGIIQALPDLTRDNARIKRLKRKVSRRRKGSRRRGRAKAQLARVERRKANRRRNALHHISKRVAAQASAIVLERLPVKAMMKSAKCTKEAPGRNVRAKAGLNESIQNSGWGQLDQMLQYKAAEVVQVSARNTSRTCHGCGTVDPRSRGSRSEFRCIACGHVAHADINAVQKTSVRGGWACCGRDRWKPAGTRRRGLAHPHGQRGRWRWLLQLAVKSIATRKTFVRQLYKSQRFILEEFSMGENRLEARDDSRRTQALLDEANRFFLQMVEDGLESPGLRQDIKPAPLDILAPMS